LIQAQAYGKNDNGEPKYGFLKLNGDAVWEASLHGPHRVHRGANMFVVDRSTCTLVNPQNFDTWGNPYAAGQLSEYIGGLSNGTLLVGISCDDASLHLAAAEATLAELGADVSDVQSRGAWAFVAVKGDPSKTVLDKELTAASALLRDPIVTVTATLAGALSYPLLQHDFRCGGGLSFFLKS